jgi:hypothetical protein
MDAIRRPCASQRLGRIRWCLLAPALCLIGCIWPWEPYPAWTVQDIARKDVPGRVLRAFEKEHPGSTILRIEQSTFNSRISGYPKLYRFTFTAADGQPGRIILDRKGRPSNLESSFDRRTEQ